jgi:cytochrome c oxidase subunit III
MNAIATPAPQSTSGWILPYRGRVGMWCLIVAESAMFTIFVVAYLYYLGKSVAGPTPKQVLEPPIFFTVCLLSSSFSMHFATRFLNRGKSVGFLAMWLLTVVLGGLFLFGTGLEWHKLIYKYGLTISTNLFGTTYYSLVGLHAFHVTVGLLALILVLVLALAGKVRPEQSERVEVLSMYWHFVDVVWVVVFTVVYILGR